MIYKEYIGELLKGRRVRFTCDCIVPLNVSGVVIDFEIVSNEVVYILRDDNNKIVKVGENTPKLQIYLD